MEDSSTPPVWAWRAMSCMASSVQFAEPVPTWGHAVTARASAGQNTTQRWQFTQRLELMAMGPPSRGRRYTPLAQVRAHRPQSVHWSWSRSTL